MNIIHRTESDECRHFVLFKSTDIGLLVKKKNMEVQKTVMKNFPGLQKVFLYAQQGKGVRDSE